MSKSYIPTTPDLDYKALPYSERKRMRDRDIATIARAIKKDQPVLSRTECQRQATSLYEQNKTYTPINSTIEDTTISSTELNIDELELETHITQGPRTIEPSNSRFANLEKPANGADNQTKTVTQNQPNQVIQKEVRYPTLGVNPNPTKDSVKRPYNQAGVPLTDVQRTEAKRTVLEVYGKCINWQTACVTAGINRQTLTYWRSIGYISQADIEEATERWRDFLRGELVKVAVIGVKQPLVHNGRIALEPDGSKSFINKRDMRVLIALAEKWLPEFQSTKKIDIVTHVEDGYINGIPSSYALVIDVRELNPQQFATIRAIAVELETKKQARYDQEQGIINAD
jgi:hypothetical protein